KVASCCEGSRQVFFQPQELWGLHLHGNLTTDVVKNRMARCIDSTSLLDRAMVHPKNNVPRRIPRCANSQRRTCWIYNNQRTCRINPDAANPAGFYPGIPYCGSN